jgi:hypothetical protein
MVKSSTIKLIPTDSVGSKLGGRSRLEWAATVWAGAWASEAQESQVRLHVVDNASWKAGAAEALVSFEASALVVRLVVEDRPTVAMQRYLNLGAL